MLILGCKGLIKHKCHKNEGNDLQLKKLLIQIIPISTSKKFTENSMENMHLQQCQMP